MKPSKEGEAVYNSPSIEVNLSIRLSDLYEAYAKIGVTDPSQEQINALAQHLRDIASSAASAVLEVWVEGQQEAGEK